MIRTITPTTGTAVLNPNVEHRTEGVQIFTITVTGTLTITCVPDGLPGQEYEIRFVTAGTDSFTVTFGAGFITTATLATGTTAARYFTVSFTSDGVKLREKSRTAVAAAA